ncbi:MAG: AraC family transcriptional regulator [Lachnospiraceae bacterium]|nr:AraC family transcriptional regulator [Lachnospiraceae bacterium]MBQ9606471.1 AraC family transcriptional regulator [Lachnospiraceae bacterium]MBR1523579.1 AraC family transcriptional regulator [Lachnospiraceae bacterium]
MYRIMLADDEGIVTDSIKFIIDKEFAGLCETETAKTGRAVIELAETFRPDIAFMDIQMPGINGIEAMKEIRRTNSSTVFIILSAYDKFDYAKEAINLGVLDYLNKPFSKEMIVDVLGRAMKQIDSAKERRRQELSIREKIETVTPVIESGFVYSILFQESQAVTENYKELLSIKDDYGYMLVMAVIDADSDSENPVGSGIRVQSEYTKIRDMIRGRLGCVTGPLLSNKIICYFPQKDARMEYDDRVRIITRCEELLKELLEKTGISARIGIGTVQPVEAASDSYKAALEALHLSKAEVAHASDLPIGCAYEPDYPADLEKKLFAAVGSGDANLTSEYAASFFAWMKETYPDALIDARLKCLEFVLWAERLSYESGGMTYRFLRRSDYLPSLMGCNDFDELESWFTGKINEAARNVNAKKEEKLDSLVEEAKSYIAENYSKDISLDEISGRVDVSPYYFTRLFKEETGETFLEYLTGLRMDKAKELMRDQSISVKDICTQVGYSDPNYFSRIFKKTVGKTPTEYRAESATG